MRNLSFVLALACSLCCFSEQRVPAQTRVEFEQRRHKLVDEILVPAGITDPRVVQAMRDTPRHEFVPLEHRAKSYFDMGLPIGDKQTISSPLIVSQMTQAIQPEATDRVLEIGTGSGYQAAVLSPLVKDVYSIEIVERLGRTARQVLTRLGYKNVHTRVGDGYLGWPEVAPFNKIIVTCSPEKVPQPLIDQLADGGLMAIPVGERYSQTLYLFKKRGDKLEKEALLPTLFVPMTGKAEEVRQHKPDPLNPRLVNGSFEEEPNFKAEGGQPGWYYERLVKRREDERANLDSHLMQGFPIDGRHVSRLDVSGWVMTESVIGGAHPDQIPYIALTLYDDQRRPLDPLLLGPFRGNSSWHEVKKTFTVPKDAREGILRIGLFGATGTACFDKLEVKKTPRP
jgi:protein-L-isoaspartate(D-aspartate) O-methyltransferase